MSPNVAKMEKQKKYPPLTMLFILNYFLMVLKADATCTHFTCQHIRDSTRLLSLSLRLLHLTTIILPYQSTDDEKKA